MALGCRVLGFRVRGLGFWGLGFLWGLGFRAWRVRLKAFCHSSAHRIPQTEPAVIAGFGSATWEFPNIRGTFLGGPYNQDPTI